MKNKIKHLTENPGKKPGRNLNKNFRVLRELVKLRFHNLTVFRLDFFGPFFVDGSLFLIQLLAFQAVYANVESVGSWRSGEMIVYIGTFSLLNAVSMTVCFFGLISIPGKIMSGEMDLYLTKPVSPLFRLTFEKMNPGSVPLMLMSLCIIVYGIKAGGIVIKGENLCAYFFWLAVMSIMYYNMEVLIRSMSFYIISNARLDQLEEACLDLCMKLPGIAFYGIFKVIFYVLLPYGIMATLPVQSLIGEMTWKTAVFGITVAAAFSLLTYFVWTRGMKRYNSASS
jgi:ABC-2 type transport system permease protein